MDVSRYAPAAKEHLVYYDSPEWYDNTNLISVLQKQCPQLCSQHFKEVLEKTRYLLDFMGPWCADIYLHSALQNALTKLSLPSSGSKGKKPFSENHLEEQDALHRILSDLKPSDKPILSTKDLSPKVICLLEVLGRYKVTQNFCGLIFTERRTSANALYTLINSSPQFSSKLRCGLLLGHGQNKHSGHRMKHNQQNNVITDFRMGKINLLIATSVAEEGLDIQPCLLVLRYDFFKDLRSYIQSRGRARHRSSNLVVLLERENFAAEQKLVGFRNEEARMLKECQDKVLKSETGEVVVEVNTEEDIETEEVAGSQHVFVVPSTKAVVTLHSSITLLYHYCHSLPHDMYSPSTPIFNLIQQDLSYKAHVLMPSNAAFRSYEDAEWHPSKGMAKKSAALKVCQKLHEMGGLDDHLQPIKDDYESEEPEDDVALDSVTADVLYNPFACCGFCLSDLTSDGLTQCFFTVFSFNPKSRYLKHRPQDLVVITSSPTDAIPSLDHFPFDNKAFQVTVHSLPGSAFIERRRLLLQAEWSIQLLSRLTHQQPVAFSCPLIFAVVPNTFENALDSHSLAQGIPFQTWPDVQECATLQDEDTAVFDRIVVNKASRHSFACVRKIYHSQHALSSSVMTRTKKTWVAPSDIPQSGKGTVFEVVPVRGVYDATTAQEPWDFSHNSEYAFQQYCEVLPVSSNEFLSATLLPLIVTLSRPFLNANTIARELNLKVKVKFLCEALTLPMFNPKTNYERLEVLGDSYIQFATSTYLHLKYPHKHEGQLFKLRSSIVRNSTLCKKAVDLNLPNYINSIRLKPSETLESIVQSKTLPVTLYQKQIADCVEAIIGASFVSYGLDAALSCFVSLGADFDAVSSWEDMKGLLDHGEDVPTEILYKIIDSYSLSQVEDILDYKFKRRRYLVEALTHPSTPTISGACYQRLCLLGDAILGFVTVQYYFSHFKELPPSRFSDMKDAIMNNSTMGYLAFSNGLHSYIIHSSTGILTAMASFCNTVTEVKEKPMFWYDLSPPRVLRLVR
jgi:endoribonuclease Dicer